VTVTARVLPTAVPSATSIPPPPPTNIPHPAPVAAPNPTPHNSAGPMIYNSWVAYSPDIHVRFFAPPSLIEMPGEGHGESYFVLYSPSDAYDFEGLAIYRFRGHRGGEAAATWKGELDANLRALKGINYSVTFGPSPQQIGDFLGQRGQFNYEQEANGKRVSGTLWVGQVGGDVMEIIYRCDPAREAHLDWEMTQIMNTIDFNPTDAFAIGG